jgi:hypothetical protein
MYMVLYPAQEKSVLSYQVSVHMNCKFWTSIVILEYHAHIFYICTIFYGNKQGYLLLVYNTEVQRSKLFCLVLKSIFWISSMDKASYCTVLYLASKLLRSGKDMCHLIALRNNRHWSHYRGQTRVAAKWCYHMRDTCVTRTIVSPFPLHTMERIFKVPHFLDKMIGHRGKFTFI